PTHRVQNLGGRALHPRALPGSKDDGGRRFERCDGLRHESILGGAWGADARWIWGGPRGGASGGLGGSRGEALTTSGGEDVGKSAWIRRRVLARTVLTDPMWVEVRNASA